MTEELKRHVIIKKALSKQQILQIPTTIKVHRYLFIAAIVPIQQLDTPPAAIMLRTKLVTRTMLPLPGISKTSNTIILQMEFGVLIATKLCLREIQGFMKQMEHSISLLQSS